MNNGKILLSFRFASAMDHSAPQFSRYCPSIPLSSSSFPQGMGPIIAPNHFSVQVHFPSNFPSFLFSYLAEGSRFPLARANVLVDTFRFDFRIWILVEPRGGEEVKNTGVLERPCLSSRERRKKNEVEKEEEGRERHTEFPRNPATALT